MRAGIIDIGSYSIKMIIGEEVDGRVEVLEALKNIVPIGKPSFLKGVISQDAINLTIQVLEKYKDILAQYKVQQLRIIATTAVRESKNKDMFLDTLRRKTGFDVEVLNVGDVVYYIDSYLSHRLKDTYAIDSKNLVIAELGAGSLDVSVMRKGYTLMNIGLSVGTLHFKQLLTSLEGSSSEITEAVQEFVENEFSYLRTALPRIKIDDIILIDENFVYIEQLLPRKKESGGLYSLKQGDCQKLVNKIKNKTGPEISKEYKIPEDIADTIYPYALVLEKFFALADIDHLYLIETSLAEAILTNIIFSLEKETRYNRADQLIAVAKSLCHQYNADINHAKFVTKMSEAMFDGLASHLGLKPEDKLYLTLASYLHDIGMFIHNRAHHKHAEYIISSLNLFRLTEDEIRIIACVARYHRKAAPNKSHFVYNRLLLKEQLLVQKLSAVLRIANSLDRSHKQKVKDISIEVGNQNDVKVIVQTPNSFLLEQADFEEKKSLFELITGGTIDLIVKN